MEFMDGVTLIEKCTEMNSVGSILFMAALPIACLLGIFVIKLGDMLFNSTGDNIYAYAGLTLSVGIVIAGLFIATKIPNMEQFREPNGEYDVVINDDVDMNVFKSSYDIIDFESGIYTVKPKDNVPQQSDTHNEAAEEVTTEINGKIYKITPIE